MTERETEIVKTFMRRSTYVGMTDIEFNETTAALQKLDRLSKEVTDSLGCTIEEVPAKAEALRQKIRELKRSTQMMKDKLGES